MLTGLTGTEEWTTENPFEGVAEEGGSQRCRLGDSDLGQGEVGATGVLARAGPLGLTVVYQPEFIAGHVLSLWLR